MSRVDRRNFGVLAACRDDGASLPGSGGSEHVAHREVPVDLGPRPRGRQRVVEDALARRRHCHCHDGAQTGRRRGRHDAYHVKIRAVTGGHLSREQRCVTALGVAVDDDGPADVMPGKLPCRPGGIEHCTALARSEKVTVNARRAEPLIVGRGDGVTRMQVLSQPRDQVHADSGLIREQRGRAKAPESGGPVRPRDHRPPTGRREPGRCDDVSRLGDVVAIDRGRVVQESPDGGARRDSRDTCDYLGPDQGSRTSFRQRARRPVKRLYPSRVDVVRHCRHRGSGCRRSRRRRAASSGGTRRQSQCRCQHDWRKCAPPSDVVFHRGLIVSAPVPTVVVT